MDSPFTSAPAGADLAPATGLVVPQAALYTRYAGTRRVIFFADGTGTARCTSTPRAVVPRGACVGVRLADALGRALAGGARGRAAGNDEFELVIQVRARWRFPRPGADEMDASGRAVAGRRRTRSSA